MHSASRHTCIKLPEKMPGLTACPHLQPSLHQLAHSGSGSCCVDIPLELCKTLLQLLMLQVRDLFVGKV